MRQTIRAYRAHVNKKLLVRQRIFFVIIAILLIINTINVIEGKTSIWLAITGFLLGTFIGLLLSRMFKILWHEKEEKVVSRLDTLGIVLLVIYIAIEIGRKWFFNHWLTGTSLNSFGLIILSGLLLGRFLGTDRRIRTILHREKKIGS